MFLIVGLGNPGAEYKNTRHNVGFMAVDELADKYSFSPFKSKFDGQIAEGKIAGEKVFILKPQTFMNLSGNSVVKAAHFYKILPEEIVVIHDDMDLPVGKVRAKIGGGTGGHNGLKSIDAAISQNYNRVRIGVGHPQGEGEVVVNHVLSNFSKSDGLIIDKNIEVIVAELPVLLKQNMPSFTHRIAACMQNIAK